MRMLRAFWNAAVRIDPSAEKLDERHMRLCRSGELAQFWKEGGLANVEEQALETTMDFRNFADYWDPFFLGQGPAGAYARGLDSQSQAKLRHAVLRELSLSSETVPFRLPARVWAVRGVSGGH
jgi:hypothetical protein